MLIAGRVDNRDVTTDNFFFDVTVDSLGRLVPGRDDAIRCVDDDCLVNRSRDQLQPGDRCLCAPAFSQIRDRYYRPDNLFADNQGRATELDRYWGRIAAIQGFGR